jgi:long-subunit fatty acid transport protein
MSTPKGANTENCNYFFNEKSLNLGYIFFPVKKFAHIIFALIIFSCMSADANPMDTYCFTSRSGGMAGALSAGAGDIEASFYNPAALSEVKSPVFGAGLLLVKNNFKATNTIAEPAENQTHLTDSDLSVFYNIGFASPLPVFGLKDRLFAGLSIILPHNALYNIQNHEKSSPSFFLLSERNKRLSAFASMAVKISGWLSLGAGISIIPDLYGDVSVDFTAMGEKNSDMFSVKYDFAPVMGLIVKPSGKFTAGLSYRGGNRTDIKVPVKAHVSDTFPPVNLMIVSTSYNNPHQISFGVQAEIFEGLKTELDIVYSIYENLDYPSPSVTVFDDKGNVGKVSENIYQKMKNTFSPRFGAEWEFQKGFFLRMGYSHVQTPLREQKDEANLLDSDRNTVSFGTGFEKEILGQNMGIDSHFQVSILARNYHEKSKILYGNPGYPSIKTEGYFYTAGIDVKLYF